MKDSQNNTTVRRKNRSLMTSLLGVTIPMVTVIVIALSVLLFRLLRATTLETASVSCSETVLTYSRSLSAWLAAGVSQVNFVSDVCARQNADDNGCYEMIGMLVKRNSKEFPYGGFINRDGVVFSTIPVSSSIEQYQKQGVEAVVRHGNAYYITLPVPSATNAVNEVVYMFVPHKVQDNIRGVFFVAVDAIMVRQFLASIKSNGMGEASLYSSNGAIEMTSDSTGELLNSASEINIGKIMAGRIKGGIPWGIDTFEDDKGNKSLCAWSSISTTQWFVTMHVKYDELDSMRTTMRNIYIVAGIVVFLIVLIYVYTITKFGIIKPLRRLKDVVNEFAAGRMYNATKLDRTVNSEIGELYDDVADMARKLVKTTDSIRSQADGIVSNGHELNTTAEHILESMGEQASAVQEISTTVEQMTSSISETADIAEGTRNASVTIANDIANVAKASAQTLESTRMVIDKIKIINEIAKRTDLLAINAAVEAARAGDNGRGFSTVAGEIKQLAERSKTAASQIDDASNHTLRITEQSTRMIEQIAPRVLVNAQKVADIAVACNEQSNGTEQINRAIQQLAHISDENTMEARVLADKAESFVKYANELISTVKYFKTSDEKTERLRQIAEQLEARTDELESLRKDLAEYDRHFAEISKLTNTTHQSDEKKDNA
ncbi:MAG: HAMP domain-containing protein [Bacteroidales bacterium]|nr:HAMP domain-containing protein [Bacteroidales bacterium]